MESLYEEHARLVTARVDGTIKARNRNQGLLWKFIRHNFSSPPCPNALDYIDGALGESGEIEQHY
jgi:hypothetical protein